MEVTVKLRLLLTSALFLFAQMPTMQTQETLDLAKITCEQFMMEKLAYTSRDVVVWLSGYYNGKRNNTIIEPQTIKKHEEQHEQQVNSYCYKHAIRLSWTPSRTCSALINEFAQHSRWSRTTKQASCSSTDQGGGKRRAAGRQAGTDVADRAVGTLTQHTHRG